DSGVNMVRDGCTLYHSLAQTFLISHINCGIEAMVIHLENTPNMFSIRIHHGGKFRRYPGRRYADGHVNIFDMVDINMFSVVVLNMMVLQLGYTGNASIEHRSKKILLTWHDSSAPTKKPACDSVTPRSLPQHDSSLYCKDYVCESVTSRRMPHFILTPPNDEFVITYTLLSGVQGLDTQGHLLLIIQSHFSDINLSLVSQQATTSQVIEDVMRQLSFEKTKLDGEAGFGDVARRGIDSAYETQYDVQSIEDKGTNDNDDDFLVDEENQIVEPDVDVHLCGISMNVPVTPRLRRKHEA
nr:transposase, MuDR [Tanacetum cinerariifolium]